MVLFVDRRERRNPRHPEVGRARAPDLINIRSKVGSKRSKGRQDDKQKDRRKDRNRGGIKIFDDKAYLKAVKVYSRNGKNRLVNQVFPIFMISDLTRHIFLEYSP